ncbi:hypothetical protein KIPB_009320, partial [Kipferlia bialata]
DDHEIALSFIQTLTNEHSVLVGQYTRMKQHALSLGHAVKKERETLHRLVGEREGLSKELSSLVKVWTTEVERHVVEFNQVREALGDPGALALAQSQLLTGLSESQRRSGEVISAEIAHLSAQRHKRRLEHKRVMGRLRGEELALTTLVDSMRPSSPSIPVGASSTTIGSVGGIVGSATSSSSASLERGENSSRERESSSSGPVLPPSYSRGSTEGGSGGDSTEGGSGRGSTEGGSGRDSARGNTTTTGSSSTSASVSASLAVDPVHARVEELNRKTKALERERERRVMAEDELAQEVQTLREAVAAQRDLIRDILE